MIENYYKNDLLIIFFFRAISEIIFFMELLLFWLLYLFFFTANDKETLQNIECLNTDNLERPSDTEMEADEKIKLNHWGVWAAGIYKKV